MRTKRIADAHREGGVDRAGGVSQPDAPDTDRLPDGAGSEVSVTADAFTALLDRGELKVERQK